LFTRTTVTTKEALQMKCIGMDAHSKRCFFVVMNHRGKILVKRRVNTNEGEILSFVRSVKGKKKLAFEEGVLSQWLYILLKDEVEELIVCQPKEHDGAKTDEKDTIEIADDLRTNRLKSVFHSDSELMNLRALVSGYDDLMRIANGEKNRLKALFRQAAIPTDEKKIYETPEKAFQLPTDAQVYVACTLYDQIALLEEQRRGYLERFESNAKQFKAIKLIMTIPGIGPIRANQIVAIMVTPHRFRKKYNLFSYAKLTKHDRDSDGKKYGKKPAKGQPMLKGVFKSAVLGAMKSNTGFRRKYEEMRASGASEKSARHAVAKAIAATVLAVWKSGKKYNDKHREVTRRQNQKCHSST
jgi:transposase